MPGRGLVQGDLEHHPGHRAHQTCLFDQVQEGVGVEQAAGGVVPAHQRLHAVHVAGGQVDLGLVVHDELVTGQCGPQLLHRLQPSGKVGFVSTAVDVMAVGGSLGLVHGDVGLAQQGVQVGAVVGEQGDPDADAAVQRDVLQGERLSQGGA